MIPELATMLEQACARLAALPHDVVWAAASRCPVTVRRGEGDATAFVPFQKVYADAEALAGAIERREEAVQSAALALLGDVDPEGAASLLVDLLRAVDLSGSHTWSLEGGVARAVGYVFNVLSARMPPRVLTELWLLGRVRMSAVPTESLSAMPLAEIARALAASPGLDLKEDRLADEHAGFADAAEVLAALSALAGSPRYHLIRRLMEQLGALRHAPAIPLLLRFATAGDTRYHAEATKALVAVGTPEALASAAGLLDQAGAGDGRIFAAAEAALRLDPRTSFARLAGRFSEASLATPVGLRVAQALLGASPALLQQDPRWLDFAVEKLGDERLHTRALLLELPWPEVEAALGRAGASTPTRARRLHPLPASPRWLERYRAGEHAAVWGEICALEDAIRDPAVLGEAQAVSVEIMTRVRKNLARIVATLKKGGYPFRAGAAKALAAPAKKTTEQLDRAERLLERPLPLSIRAFHEVVGKVDLREAVEPEDDDEAVFVDLAEHEPLAVAPIKEMLAAIEDEVKVERRHPPPLRRAPAELYLADDPGFKQWPDEHGNDRPVHLALMGEGADGLVALPQKEGAPAPARVGFVDYLRRYLRGGGFLWLPDAEDEDARALLTALDEGSLPF